MDEDKTKPLLSSSPHEQYLKSLGQLCNDNLILCNNQFLIRCPSLDEYQNGHCPTKKAFIKRYHEISKEKIREYQNVGEVSYIVIEIQRQQSEAYKITTPKVPSTQPTSEHQVPTDRFFSSLFSSVSELTNAIFDKLSNVVGSVFRSNKITDPVSTHTTDNQVTSNATHTPHTTTPGEFAINPPSESKSFLGKIFDSIFQSIGSLFTEGVSPVITTQLHSTDPPNQGGLKLLGENVNEGENNYITISANTPQK